MAAPVLSAEAQGARQALADLARITSSAFGRQYAAQIATIDKFITAWATHPMPAEKVKAKEEKPAVAK